MRPYHTQEKKLRTLELSPRHSTQYKIQFFFFFLFGKRFTQFTLFVFLATLARSDNFLFKNENDQNIG
jgi:hypothetical protein